MLSKIEEKLSAPSISCPLVSFVTRHKQSVCHSDESRTEDAEGPAVPIVKEQRPDNVHPARLFLLSSTSQTQVFLQTSRAMIEAS